MQRCVVETVIYTLALSLNTKATLVATSPGQSSEGGMRDVLQGEHVRKRRGHTTMNVLFNVLCVVVMMYCGRHFIHVSIESSQEGHCWQGLGTYSCVDVIRAALYFKLRLASDGLA